jgi:hypothetical protein
MLGVNQGSAVGACIGSHRSQEGFSVQLLLPVQLADKGLCRLGVVC